MSAIRHTDECARPVSNLAYRCNCRARPHADALVKAKVHAAMVQQYLDGNPRPSPSWLRVRVAMLVDELTKTSKADAEARRQEARSW